VRSKWRIGAALAAASAEALPAGVRCGERSLNQISCNFSPVRALDLVKEMQSVQVKAAKIDGAQMDALLKRFERPL